MKLLWLIITILSLFLVYITLPYWSFRPDIHFLLAKPNLVHYMPWRTVFYIHIAGGTAALLAVPLQLIPQLRNKNIRLHKILGKVYGYAILAVAAPTGLYMAFFAEGGLVSSIGFILMSFGWWITTFIAIQHAIKGNIARHRAWMYRSIAFTLAAVTLRLQVPLFSHYLDMDHQFVVVLTAYTSWIMNLILVEALLLTYYFSPKPIQS